MFSHAKNADVFYNIVYVHFRKDIKVRKKEEFPNE